MAAREPGRGGRIVENQAPAWSPAFVDRALARRVHAELLRIAEAWPRPGTRCGSPSTATWPSSPRTFGRTRTRGVRLQALVVRLLDHEATREALSTLVGATRRAVVALIDEPEGELRSSVTEAVQRLGDRLTSDDELRTKVDGWLGDAVEHVVTTYRDEITRTITDTVDRWDGAEAARRIELAAGRDLQFIRVNGTVVGARPASRSMPRPSAL